MQFEDKFIARVLIDGGSSLNIWPLTILKRLGKVLHEIQMGSMNVKAFDGSQRATIGEINLDIQMGPNWFDDEFHVLDISTTYNLLLGRPWIYAVGVVASTLHQVVKFEWNHQEVIIHGDGSNPIYTNQTISVIENKRKLGGETYHHIERVNTIEKDRWWSNKIESILMWLGYEPSKSLSRKLQGITKPIQPQYHGMTFGLGYEYTVQENQDWTLPWHTDYYPLEQPIPPMHQTFCQTDVIWGSKKDEILDVKETRISIHLSPSEKEEYVRFLREYEDIFAWSYDDMTGLSTSIVAHKLPTNPMCQPVKQKLSKFKPYMSLKIKEEVIKKIKDKLNHAKCAFGVPAGKMLGFIVSRRGMELDPSKIKAVQDLPLPKNKKGVMSFLGHLNYISRFIAQSTVICEPIFKMLRKDAAKNWTEECEKAFSKIKEYLSQLPVLVPPEPGRPLLLYFSMLDGAFGCVLGNMMKPGGRSRQYTI
ncbi:uncharacterized protein [Nicotiana tomentosiformis]|uniref:uncharacterized protein n=1 Tax=Nicotiana tomentosiformis TaxID=4098 RepID=UPI00388CEC66